MRSNSLIRKIRMQEPAWSASRRLRSPRHARPSIVFAHTAPLAGGPGNALAAEVRVVERRSSFRALIVEDDGAILNLVKIVLEREGFTVEGVRTGAAAIALLAAVAYDLLIVDLMLPMIGGEEVLGYLELTQPTYLRRVVVTTASPGRMSCEFLERVCRLLAKPFDIDELVLIAKECANPDAPEHCDATPAPR
jgi:CheY-like chemotaxis protein